MGRRVIICALALGLIFLPPADVAAQDYASWIRYSDRADNPLIVEMIREADLNTALEIAQAVGLREDVCIRDIILEVGETVNLRPQWERELVLRMLLASVFSPGLDDEALEAALLENREGIDFLVAGLPDFTLSLKREVIRLLGFLHPPEYAGPLMAEGRRLADLLTLQRGDLNGEQAGLTLMYLQTVQRVGNPEFSDVVLMILERSRHLEVAGAARAVARDLLSAE